MRYAPSGDLVCTKTPSPRCVGLAPTKKTSHYSYNTLIFIVHICVYTFLPNITEASLLVYGILVHAIDPPLTHTFMVYESLDYAIDQPFTHPLSVYGWLNHASDTSF